MRQEYFFNIFFCTIATGFPNTHKKVGKIVFCPSRFIKGEQNTQCIIPVTGQSFIFTKRSHIKLAFFFKQPVFKWLYCQGRINSVSVWTQGQNRQEKDALKFVSTLQGHGLRVYLLSIAKDTPCALKVTIHYATQPKHVHWF